MASILASQNHTLFKTTNTLNTRKLAAARLDLAHVRKEVDKRA